MVELSVKYNRNKNPKVFDLVLPGEWAELSESNILYIGNYWQSWQLMIRNNVPLTKAKAMLFIELTNIKSKFRQKELMEALGNLSPDSGINVLELTNFVFEKFDLVKNLIPEINTGKETFIGPSDKLTNISIEEFSFAFSCYGKFHVTGEEKHLNKLAGVLYRPANTNYAADGNKRVEFNSSLVDRYEIVFSNLPDGYKNAIYLFFKGSLDHIAKRFPVVFPKDEKSSVNNSAGSFHKTIVSMSGDKFGSFEETKRQNLYMILDALQEIMIENQKNKPA